MALDLDIQAEGSGCPLSESAAVVDKQARAMILDNLDVASQYFAESEHRIARQHCLIAKLRAKGPTPLWAVAFLRSLQASRVMHRADRIRLMRALEIMDERPGTALPPG